MRFDLSPATFDPGQTQKRLLRQQLAGRDHRPGARILDLGTGTGCLLMACLSELPRTTGVGIDISAESVMVATANAHRHGFAVVDGFTKLIFRQI